MAIGTTPLFSKISGSAGPIDFRTRRNGKIEIGKKRIPANPQSTRQLEVRAGYGRLHELWQNASYIDKAQYERLGKLYHTSAWNAFLMRHQSAMSAAPVASWGMVESSGLDLHDLTTNGNLGTISGAVWETTGPADLSSLYFDGIDDKVTVTPSPELDHLQTIIIRTWIKPLDITPWPIIITRGGWAVGDPYIIGIGANNKLYVRFLTVGGGLGGYTTYIPTFDWTFAELSYNLTNGLKCIINNQIVLTRAPTGAIDYTTTPPINIGGEINPDNAFKGYIGSMEIYPNIQNDDQSLQYYNNTKHLYGVYP